MDVLILLAFPLVILWLTLNLFFPRQVLVIAAGVLLRDFVLFIARIMLLLFSFAFGLLALLFRFPSINRRSRQPRRRH